MASKKKAVPKKKPTKKPKTKKPNKPTRKGGDTPPPPKWP